jgi:hypothetical protein
MPSNDYIPRRDADFRDWVLDYARNIAAAPAAFMLSQAESDGITQVAENFVAKYDIARNPKTRSSGTIAAKQDARSIAESLCRAHAILIKKNRGIDDESKIDIGIRPINPNRARRNCPQTSPELTILGGTPGMHTLKYRDPDMGDSHDKPVNAVGLQVFIAYSDGREPPPVSQAEFLNMYTRNPIVVKFEPEFNKKGATYYARWQSYRGETGPWSLPVSFTIAA